MISPITKMLDAVVFTPEARPESMGGLPYVVASGILLISGFSLRVYQLNTGERVIDADDMEEFFGGSKP